jgi:hypothetical protein
LIVHDTPAWAQRFSGISCGPIIDTEFDAFGEFMADLVARYKGLVDYYEIWNEPDVDSGLVPANSPYGCWGDASDTQYYGGNYYGEMLKSVYPKVKEVDAATQVLVGGLLMECDPDRVFCTTTNSAKFLSGILASGAGDYFDGVSFHAYDYYLGGLGDYGNPNWNSSSTTTGSVLNAKAKYLQNTLSAYGREDKYLLNSESAILCGSGCDQDFELTKAYYVAETYAAAMSQNLRANLWYSTRAGWRSSDLFDSNLNPLPAFDAFSIAQNYMTGLRSIFPINKYPGLMGYELLSDTSTVWMLWSSDHMTHTIELPALPSSVVDVFGNIEAADQTISVGVEPIYISFAPDFVLFLPSVLNDPELILNPGFEEGEDTFGNPINWIFGQGGEGLGRDLIYSNPTIPQLDSEIPYGTGSVLLGSTAYSSCAAPGVPIGYASVDQTVDMSEYTGGSRPVLYFDYVMYTQDGSAFAGTYDRFEVYAITGSSEDLIYSDGRDEPDLKCNEWYRIPATGWKQGRVDLSSGSDYRDKMVTFSFRNYNRFDRYYNTFTYLDNVRIVFE